MSCLPRVNLWTLGSYLASAMVSWLPLPPPSPPQWVVFYSTAQGARRLQPLRRMLDMVQQVSLDKLLRVKKECPVLDAAGWEGRILHSIWKEQ